MLRRSHFRFHFGRGSRLALALCGSVAALATPAVASACPSLRHVTGFKMQISMKVGVVASGEYPDKEGMQTIQLGRVADKVNFRLGDKKHAGFLYDFKGPSSGGKILVDDVYEDTGTDQAGELKYNGPANKRSGEAVLEFDRKRCKSELLVGFQLRATYEGDPEVYPGYEVGFGFTTARWGPIPEDLRMSIGAPLRVYPQCVHLEGFCASLTSGWMPDLLNLWECHTPLPIGGNCPDDSNPLFSPPPAFFVADVRPIFKKS